MLDPAHATELLREFCADILAAYGSQGQEPDEIIGSLSKEWPDLAVTYVKAQKYVDSLD